MSDLVLLHIQDHIATLTLNAPERANGIDVAVAGALLDAAKRLEGTPGLRAMLFTGAGRMFSGGGDIGVMADGAEQLPVLIDAVIERAHDAVWRLASLPFPVVCAVQGAAAGGGLGVALTADYVVAEEGARFRAAHTSLGFAGDCGVSWFLPRAVGARRARQLVLTNRALTAAEALDWGLVDEVVPADRLLDAARERVQRFAEGPTLGFAAAKRLQLAALLPDLKTHLAHERAEMAVTARTEDPKEAVRAFVEKRRPVFRGR